jgi:hypothetical protein
LGALPGIGSPANGICVDASRGFGLEKITGEQKEKNGQTSAVAGVCPACLQGKETGMGFVEAVNYKAKELSRHVCRMTTEAPLL